MEYSGFNELFKYEESIYSEDGAANSLIICMSPKKEDHEIRDYMDLHPLPPTIASPPNMFSLLSEFCYIRGMKEFNKYGVSRVPEFDRLNLIFGRFSLNQIYWMSQSTLWRLHCAYGRKIQKLVCYRLNKPLPIAPKKKRTERQKTEPRQCPLLATMNPVTGESQPIVSIPRTSSRRQVVIHEFCIDILREPFYTKSRCLLEWIDERAHKFRILEANALALLWTKVKDSSVVSKENFSRAIRYSRKNSDFFKSMTPQPKKIRQFTPLAFMAYERIRSQFQEECDKLAQNAQ